jgi:hypothetical protein
MIPQRVCSVPRLWIVSNGAHTLLCQLQFLLLLQDGFTPLHCAVDEGYSDIAEALVRAGAKVNAADKVGMICFRLAQHACALHCNFCGFWATALTLCFVACSCGCRTVGLTSTELSTWATSRL